MEGQEYVDQLFRDKEKITKSSVMFFENKIAEYQEVVDNFTNPLNTVL